MGDLECAGSGHCGIFSFRERAMADCVDVGDGDCDGDDEDGVQCNHHGHDFGYEYGVGDDDGDDIDEGPCDSIDQYQAR